jgi:hypothetical protein
MVRHMSNLGFADGSSLIIFWTDYISIQILDLVHCWEHRCTSGVCWGDVDNVAGITKLKERVAGSTKLEW